MDTQKSTLFLTDLKLSLINKDWFKRRIPRNVVKPVELVAVTGFKKQHNHMCRITVKFSDGSEKDLISRVLFNKLQDRWTIDGMHAIVLVEDI